MGTVLSKTFPTWMAQMEEGRTSMEGSFHEVGVRFIPIRRESDFSNLGSCIVYGTAVAHRVLLMNRGQS